MGIFQASRGGVLPFLVNKAMQPANQTNTE